MNKAVRYTLLSMTRKLPIVCVYMVVVGVAGWFGATRGMAILFAGLGLASTAFHLWLLRKPQDAPKLTNPE